MTELHLNLTTHRSPGNLHLQPMDWREYERWADRLVKLHKILRPDLDAMVRKQKGLCAICKERRRLVLDHNHKTNKARGLLCYRCNGILGFLEKYRFAFVRASAYLRRRGV